MFEEAIKLCFARDVTTVSVIQREQERGINSCPNWPYIRCFVPIYEKPDLELGVSTVLVPRQRHVSFENEKFEDKIDYDERSACTYTLCHVSSCSSIVRVACVPVHYGRLPPLCLNCAIV